MRKMYLCEQKEPEGYVVSSLRKNPNSVKTGSLMHSDPNYEDTAFGAAAAGSPI